MSNLLTEAAVTAREKAETVGAFARVKPAKHFIISVLWLATVLRFGIGRH